MKKLLLSMACLATVAFANAAEVTYNVKDATNLKGEDIPEKPAQGSSNGEARHIQPLEGMTLGDYNFTFASEVPDGKTGTAPAYYWSMSTAANQTMTVRLYNYNTMTITAPEGIVMSAINFAGSNGGTERVSSDNGTATSTKTAIDWIADAPANSVKFSFTGSFRITSMTITYAEGGESKLPAELSFPEDTYSVNLGEAFAAPALTKATDAAVTYTSSDEAVATVAADGAVTVVAAGTTVITAKAEATDKYYGGTASYTLKVIDPNAPVAIYAGLTDGITDWTVEDGTLPEGLSFVWTWDKSYKYAKASGYYKKAYDVEGAMLISPEINLAGYTDLSLSFSMLANYFNGGIADACSVLISVDGGAFEPLTISQWPADDFKADWVNTNIDLNSYKDKKIKVAFKYTSTSAVAGTWEVKNFAVEGKLIQSGIDNIATDENAPVEYYNLQGVRVENPESGLYIRRQGNKVTKVIL